MSEAGPPEGFEVLTGDGSAFGEISHGSLERAPGGRRVLIAVLLLAMLGAAAVTVSLLRGDDASDDESDSAPATTVPSDPVATTQPAPPPRTTLPPPVDAPDALDSLPAVRPAGLLVATLTGGPDRSDGSTDALWLYRLDLLTGQAAHIGMRRSVHTLLSVDRWLIAGMGREAWRIDPQTGESVLIASDAEQIAKAHGPDGIVTVSHSDDSIIARVIGADGVFRSMAQLPAQAVVHGAIGNHVVVSLAGQVMLTDGRHEALDLRDGRVLGVAAETVVRLRCELRGCTISTIAFSTVRGEDSRPQWCDEICESAAQGFGDDLADADALSEECRTICSVYPLVTGSIDEQIVELPPVLARLRPDQWDAAGLVSPDRSRLAIRIRPSAASQLRAFAVIDLAEGTARVSPEQSAELDGFAWSSDSRFLLYAFGRDLIIWDIEAQTGQVRSGRARIGEPLDRIVVQ